MCTDAEKMSRMDDKLGKNEVVARSRRGSQTEECKCGKGMTKKRVLAAAIIGAGILALVAFAVIIYVFELGPVREIESTDEEAAVVGNVAGYEVRYEELRYVTLLIRRELDSELGEYSSLDESGKLKYRQELDARVSEKLKSNYVILSLCEKYGVDTDSKEARTYVKNSIADLVDEVGGKKEYRAWLSENDLTDALVRLTYKTEYLETVLLEELTERGDEIIYSENNVGENNIDDFVDFVMRDDSYIKVIHAFYPKENKYVEGWDAGTRAAEAHQRLSAAADDSSRLSLMRSEIGKAPFIAGYSVTGTDYYITYGQMHEDYESVAYSLPEYGVGEIVELEEGYYIIMRVPKERDEVAPRAYELIENYRYAILKGIEDKHSASISFSGNEYFDSLKLEEIE